ncbi:MAG TPA: hypothetical protein VK989_09280 [Polyangia bacterium]|jgi:hypothetical protein|nr:hypothetical protein [Polyangia bacterium]
MHDESFEPQLMMLVAAAAAIFAVGCSDDLPAKSRLERTRLLGARVQLASDPTRADVTPGERATVEWLLAGPRAPGALAWTFAVCDGIEGACAGPASMTASGTGAPVLAPFTAPPAMPVDDAHAPLMLGAVCEGGAPTFDAATMLPGCAAASTSANPARFAIPVFAASAAPNHHPNLANDLVTLDGAPWTTEPAGDAGGPCDATSAMPIVDAGATERQLRLTTDADDRESYVVAGVTTLEALELSSFATAGKLGGSYVLIAATDADTDAAFTAKWTPPVIADVPAAGMTVQFHFVVRDGRGGLDWAHRALCVVAP